jgi:hypothetical protein
MLRSSANTNGLAWRGLITTRGGRYFDVSPMANEPGRLVTVVDPARPPSVVPVTVDVINRLTAVDGMRICVDIHRRGRDDDVFLHCNGRMRRANFGCASR